MRWPSNRRAVAHAAGLMLLVSVAAALRVPSLDSPSLWFDEILGVRGIGDEHGPLYYAVMRGGLALGGGDAGIRFPFALAGLLSVALLYVVVSHWLEWPTAFVASLLLAASPIHIYYSREARPYALMILWLIAGLCALSPVRAEPHRWRGHAAVLTAAVLLALTSLHAAFYIPLLLVPHLAATAAAGTGKRVAVVTVAYLAVGVVGVLVYLPALKMGPVALAGHEFSFGALWRFTQAIVSGHSEQHPARPDLWVSVGLMVIGAACIAWRRPVLALIAVASALAGVYGPILTLGLRGHFVTARFALAGLPAIVVLLAAGVVAVAAPVRRLLDGWRSLAEPVRTVVAIAIAAWVGYRPAVVAEAIGDKPDWRRAAEVIAARAQPGDRVVVSSIYGLLCLQYHLPRLARGLDLVNAEHSADAARQLVEGRPAAFLVRRFEPGRDVLDRWMDRAHLLWSTPIEGLRVYFYPDQATYLLSRLPPSELAMHERRLWGDLQGQVLVSDESMPFLLSGWGNLEKDPNGRLFRWAEGMTVRFFVPVVRQRPARLQLDLERFPLLASQSVAIEVDGVEIASAVIPRGASFHDFDVSRVTWTVGGHVVTLRFSATGRSEGATDQRLLAAVLRSVRLR